MDQQERITELLRNSQQRAIDAGTRVRCPECDAGIGKFCRTTHGKPVIHSMRVELQKATFGTLTPDAIYG